MMRILKTKIDILKLLNERNYTVSELSEKLGKSKSTISEHLNVLYKMGLVEKESYSKWVYYKITDKGKKVLENLESLILILGSIFTLIGIWVYYLRGIRTKEVHVLSKSVANSYTKVGFHQDILFLSFLGISIILLIFIGYLTYKIIRK
ncbi:winged helix-turn-helix domain-containing protein [Methanotorris formicicus]|uniref:Regulatory protein ArsR n=1 Tax=Methanotorris formicicus Mc-S-70 TaxID=647171 RepID=H1KWN2_9EURY|nr:winged helix-turn-helix domain-containing protein [Methanotorris formicicus]EHP89147.1 regulatory protein ArsR [Methanotorris formicicus Mc-S-70]